MRGLLLPISFILGVLLAQVPNSVSQLTATADCGLPLITASIGTTTNASDTVSFVCSNLPPAISSCPGPVSIPANALLTQQVFFRINYLGQLIVVIPGLSTQTGPLTCTNCTWSNNPNPAPGDYFIATANENNTQQFVNLVQEWSGYPALPVIQTVCSTCGFTVTNVPGVVTVTGP